MREKELVVAFPIFNGRIEKFVLLGERQKDPWKGCLSGFGGNIEKYDKSPRQRQVIELQEESKIIVQEESLIKRAEFISDIEGKEPKLLHVYVAYDFKGKWQNTEEMHPEWFPFKALPINKMIKGDEFWVPRVLAGEHLTGTIFRDEKFNFLRIEVQACDPCIFLAA